MNSKDFFSWFHCQTMESKEFLKASMYNQLLGRLKLELCLWKEINNKLNKIKC
jgi:hypothetical protein